MNTTAIGLNQPNDLIHQINDKFIPNYITKNDIGWKASNSLFALYFGTNDIERTYKQQDLNVNVAVIESYLGQLNKVWHVCDKN